jgi:NAD(P)-dependent dehydrogenase (short-subunit alcohol dehydrogenase family)
MSRVLITGSTEGLGLMAARLLANDGHSVTLHARSAARAEDARAALPAATGVVVGDLSSMAGMRQVAERANAGGPYDRVGSLLRRLLPSAQLPELRVAARTIVQDGSVNGA